MRSPETPGKATIWRRSLPGYRTRFASMIGLLMILAKPAMTNVGDEVNLLKLSLQVNGC